MTMRDIPHPIMMHLTDRRSSPPFSEEELCSRAPDTAGDRWEAWVLPNHPQAYWLLIHVTDPEVVRMHRGSPAYIRWLESQEWWVLMRDPQYPRIVAVEPEHPHATSRNGAGSCIDVGACLAARKAYQILAPFDERAQEYSPVPPRNAEEAEAQHQAAVAVAGVYAEALSYLNMVDPLGTFQSSHDWRRCADTSCYHMGRRDEDLGQCGLCQRRFCDAHHNLYAVGRDEQEVVLCYDCRRTIQCQECGQLIDLGLYKRWRDQDWRRHPPLCRSCLTAYQEKVKAKQEALLERERKARLAREREARLAREREARLEQERSQERRERQTDQPGLGEMPLFTWANVDADTSNADDTTVEYTSGLDAVGVTVDAFDEAYAAWREQREEGEEDDGSS